MRPIVFLLSAAAALAQTVIAPPRLGAVRDSSGAVYAVIGVAGNFQLADTGITNALSTAFSGAAGLVKQDTELLVLDKSNQIASRLNVPAGPALFAFDAAGAPALVYCSGALSRFENGALTRVSWTGQAVAIVLVAPQSASIVVSRDDGLWIQGVSLTSGSVENEVPLAGISGPVALLASGDIVYTNGSEILVRDGRRVERRVNAGIAIDSFEQMSRDWIAVREAGSGRVFAFRTTTRSPQLYQLPEVSQ